MTWKGASSDTFKLKELGGASPIYFSRGRHGYDEVTSISIICDPTICDPEFALELMKHHCGSEALGFHQTIYSNEKWPPLHTLGAQSIPPHTPS
jgi:hypothetical protein